MTSDQPVEPAQDPLVAGPLWYRARIRRLGAVFGLAPMLLMGVIAWAALQLGDGKLSGTIGLFGGVSAAPGLLVAGVPFSDSSWHWLAVAASVPIWALLGLIAARRATRSPVADWSDFRGQLLWLTLAVVIGATGALLASTAILGESLVL